jgi:hypothetical protein
LSALRRLAGRGAFEGIFDALQRRCALILESAPLTETQWQGLWLQGNWGAAVLAARGVQGRVMDLLIGHHIDPNPAYRDRAIEELSNLVGWSSWVDPCHNHIAADLCTAEAAVAVAVGLDWLWEDLSEQTRESFIDAIKVKAIAPYLEGCKQGALWTSCYHSWNAVVNAGVGIAALALSDESAAARKAAAQARKNLKHFFDALGREGGWDEGLGYWGYAMRYVLLLAEAARRLDDDQTFLHQRGMDATGLFPVYFTPNGQPATFGDNNAVPLAGTFYLLARHFGRREVTWWLDTYAFHRDASNTGWSTAGLAMLFRSPAAKTPKDPHLKVVKVFNQIGWAALADRWPKPSFYVAAKAGDLSANHSQRDMNSLQLQVDGEMLLTDQGSAPYSREYLSDAREGFYEVQARGHNTVIVAERDQRIDAQGRIVESRKGADFRYLALDAGSACGENASFARHIVMLVEPRTETGVTLVVLDDLDNGVPEKVHTFWHTRGQINLDGLAGTIIGARAGLHFALASTVAIKASVKSHPLERRGRDNVIRISAGVLGRALTASVFSRRKIGGPVEIVEDDRGGVCVRMGKAAVTFTMGRQDLRLASVEGGA